MCFFFSSRRRHTRWTGDWSSDVCSSDLRCGTTGGCCGGCARTRAATPGHPPAYKETMLRRISLAILLAIQALGGGAVSLAHARDAVVAPPGYEASHSARCAILHDELRC